jgi:hypothetical protein
VTDPDPLRLRPRRVTRGGKRGTRRAQNRHGGAPGGVRPASWDARRLTAPDTPRHGVSHGCSAEHPNDSRRSAHPSTGVSEAKRQSPDAAMRARERDGLFEMVKNAVSDGRPHPEERAREKLSANSNARARVSKDEDEPLCALMLRDASQRGSALKDMRSCRAAMLLSMRAGERCAFWRNETNVVSLASRLSRRSAGTTPDWLRHQLAAAGKRRQLDSSVSRLFFTGNRATPTCRAGTAAIWPNEPNVSLTLPSQRKRHFRGTPGEARTEQAGPTGGQLKARHISAKTGSTASPLERTRHGTRGP